MTRPLRVDTLSMIRTAAAVACLAAFAWLGWQASVWRNKAARFDDLAAVLRTETARRVAAVVNYNTLQVRVRELEAQARAGRTRTQVERVVRHVPQSVDCDLGDEPVGLLNRARNGMP